MNQLDDIQHLLSLDKSSMYKAIKDLPLQLEQAWDEAMRIEIPDSYKNIQNILITGMGGSALGPHSVMSVYFSKVVKPVQIVNGYHLPGYANENTLVIASSNSGNTEETVSAALEAKERGCKIIGISTGGKLKDFLLENNYPAYIFDQKYNQSGQPRMSTGYMFLGLLAFFIKIEAISIDIEEVTNAIKSMNDDGRMNGIEIETSQNPAKQIAEKLFTSIPFIVGADFLAGSIHTTANQVNENAKKLSAYFLISEMNHHLLEGLGYEQNKEAVKFWIIDSELYPARIRQRVELTKTIIEKNNFKTVYTLVKGNSPIAQAFNLLQLGSYVSYYLAILNNIDPSPIPWVNFFKKELDQ